MGEDKLAKFKEAFAAELKGVDDIEELKELYASEIARRDVLISNLQEQNQLLLNSMVKQKHESLNTNKHSTRIGTSKSK